VPSALGTRPPIKVVIPVVVACPIVVRVVTLSWPVALFVEAGVPVLSILTLTRRTTIISDGTRNIVEAMERHGVRRFVCESSLEVGDSKWKAGIIHNVVAVPLFLRNVFADKVAQRQVIERSALG